MYCRVYFVLFDVVLDEDSDTGIFNKTGICDGIPRQTYDSARGFIGLRNPCTVHTHTHTHTHIYTQCMEGLVISVFL